MNAEMPEGEIDYIKDKSTSVLRKQDWHWLYPVVERGPGQISFVKASGERVVGGKRLRSMKGKRTDIIIIYLICLITKVVISLRVYPVLYLSDEVSALSATALAAGFDWSAVVSHAGYYGFGFLALLVPLFNIVRSPVWIYRIILIIFSMIEAL